MKSSNSNKSEIAEKRLIISPQLEMGKVVAIDRNLWVSTNINDDDADDTTYQMSVVSRRKSNEYKLEKICRTSMTKIKSF